MDTGSGAQGQNSDYLTRVMDRFEEELNAWLLELAIKDFNKRLIDATRSAPDDE